MHAYVDLLLVFSVLMLSLTTVRFKNILLQYKRHMSLEEHVRAKTIAQFMCNIIKDFNDQIKLNEKFVIGDIVKIPDPMYPGTFLDAYHRNIGSKGWCLETEYTGHVIIVYNNGKLRLCTTEW